MPSTCGIYSIRNMITGAFYVGQSVCIERRWRAHRSDLTRGVHVAQRLQRSWDKHGAQTFEFAVLELCDRAMLTLREQHWMDRLKPAFNHAPAAGTIAGIRWSQEVIDRRANANKGRKRTPEQRAAIAKAKVGHGVGKRQTAELVERRIGQLRGRPRPDVSERLSGVPRPEHVLAALAASNERRFAERRQRISAALHAHPEMSSAAIARLLGVNRDTVRKYRNASQET